MTPEELRDQVSDWLLKRPEATRRQEAILVATRAGLRVFPLIGGIRQYASTFMPACRALAVARFASDYPKRAIDLSAAEAAEAAGADNGAADASAQARYAAHAANAAAYAAYAAAYAAYAAANAADAASFAAAYAAAHATAYATASGYANQDFIAAIQNDLRKIELGNDLAEVNRLPLWPDSGTPEWFSDAYQELRQRLEKDDQNWWVWTTWFEDRWTGKPIEVDLEEQILTQTKIEWDEPAKAVNAVLAKIIDAYWDESDEVNKEVVQRGVGLNYQRETSLRDLRLGHDKTAFSLAHMFRVTDGEFSFALFGNWGSGKTSIARCMVSEYLTNEEAYKEKLAAFDSSASTQNELAKYEVVWFNAWKYRRRPELWVWMYESFLNAYLTSKSPVHRFIKTARLGIERKGLWSVVTLLIILAILTTPFGWFKTTLSWVIWVVGPLGAVILLTFYRRADTHLRQLFDTYGIAKSHKDKLGMLALIGDDLTALIKSWSYPKQFSDLERYGSWLILAVTMVLMIYILPKNDVGFVLVIFWLLLVIPFLVGINCQFGKTDRILLIVDDLDRCAPEDIVELIDSIKLLIDNKEIADVLQVLVLADKRILDSALEKRFLEQKKAKSEDIKLAMREHLEKVFLGHLELPAVEPQDALVLIDGFAKEFNESASSATSSQTEIDGQVEASATSLPSPSELKTQAQLETTVPNSDGNEGTHKTELEAKDVATTHSLASEDGVAEQTPQNVKKFDEISVALTAAEVNAIKDALQERLSNENYKLVSTPRAMRSFVFKFQLARMLLAQDGVTADRRQLSRALADKIAIANGSEIERKLESDEIERVTDLVA